MPLIINLIHHDIVWLYLICWAVEFIHDFLLFIWDIFEAVQCLLGEGCMKNPDKADLLKLKKQKEKEE